MGDLLFKFVEWRSKPHKIDLTDEASEGVSGMIFQPPVDTIMSLVGEGTPCLLDIISSDTAYSM